MYEIVEALPEIITALGAAIATIIAAARGRSTPKNTDEDL